MPEQNMKPNEKPKSILEALGNRADEISEPVTPEEILTEAIADDATETMLGTHLPPQVEPLTNQAQTKIEKAIVNQEFPIQENSPKQESQSPRGKTPEKETETISIQPGTITMSQNTWNPPEKEKPTIPASSTVPPPVKGNSIPESPGLKKSDSLRRLLEFVRSSAFNENYVQLHLNHIARIPSVIPVPAIWNIPGSVSVARLIYQTIMQPGYVESIWPSLSIVMGTSRDNMEWCCNVLCTLATFDVIRCLPYRDIIEN